MYSLSIADSLMLSNDALVHRSKRSTQDPKHNPSHESHTYLHLHGVADDLMLISDASVHRSKRYSQNSEHDSTIGCRACTYLLPVADDLMLINDISVDESEDLPKILGPLVEEGPMAALGRAHQQPSTAFNPAPNKRQLLQTMKLAAPATVKLQVCPCAMCHCDDALCYITR